MRESAPGAPPSLVDLPSGCAFHPRCRFAMPICIEETPECRNIGGSAPGGLLADAGGRS